MKTLAAVLHKLNAPLALEELEAPELKSGQVLVKVAYSGVCRSQLNEVRGLKGEDKFLPHTLGHEGSGIVEAVGPQVTKVKPGDHVVLTWIKGSGMDVPSAKYIGKDNISVNSGAISTFLTKAVVSENRLVKVPDKLSLREAALLGCAIPTGAGIVLNDAQVKPGSTVAVFGTGGIGLSSILAADMAGAGRIIAVDVLEHKLEQARRSGATHAVNARAQDPLEAIMEITAGRGADYAIESAGRKEAMEAAFKCVRAGGGLCVLAGNLPAGHNISIDPFDLIRGKRIAGTWGGRTDPDKDIPMYAEFILSGRMRPDKLVTHNFRLEEINTALEALEAGDAGRAIIEL